MPPTKFNPGDVVRIKPEALTEGKELVGRAGGLYRIAYRSSHDYEILPIHADGSVDITAFRDNLRVSSLNLVAWRDEDFEGPITISNTPNPSGPRWRRSIHGTIAIEFDKSPYQWIKFAVPRGKVWRYLRFDYIENENVDDHGGLHYEIQVQRVGRDYHQNLHRDRLTVPTSFFNHVTLFGGEMAIICEAAQYKHSAEEWELTVLEEDCPDSGVPVAKITNEAAPKGRVCHRAASK